MKTTRILFLTDFTRPAASRIVKGHSEAASSSFMFRDLLRAQLEWMIEGEVEIVASGDDDRFLQRGIYDASGRDCSVEDWAVLGKNLSEIPDEFLSGLFDFDLIIAYEIPWSLKEYFSKEYFPYIELSSHPVRFMKDFLLGVELGIEDSRSVFEETAVDRLDVAVEAGYLKAFMRPAERVAKLPERSSLFIGQKAVDRAMIKEDGSFLGGEELADMMLATIPENVGPVLLKLHPLDRGDNEAVKILKKKADIAGDYTGNIYSALASDNLERVITVSSSVGIEASFFGKEVDFVTGPSVPVTFRGEAMQPGHWHSVSSRFLDPKFLALLLSGTLPVRNQVLKTATFAHSSEMEPNRLRNMFNAYYGYTFIANDPIIKHSRLADVYQNRKDIVWAAKAVMNAVNSRPARLLRKIAGR